MLTTSIYDAVKVATCSFIFIACNTMEMYCKALNICMPFVQMNELTKLNFSPNMVALVQGYFSFINIHVSLVYVSYDDLVFWYKWQN